MGAAAIRLGVMMYFISAGELVLICVIGWHRQPALNDDDVHDVVKVTQITVTILNERRTEERRTEESRMLMYVLMHYILICIRPQLNKKYHYVVWS